MALSKKKQAKVEMVRRQNVINARSLNGRGYFMDASVEADIKAYIETGDDHFLRFVPDYSAVRNSHHENL